MAIYRGPGGSGDAVNDSSSETRLAVEARDAAIAAQAAAEAAQAAAETAETNAELAETNAETAETNAETAEANAETAEANAEAAQAAAEAAQAAAEAAQTAAELAETNAELAETNAETAETNAETAASLAQDWATKTSSAVAGGEFSAKYHAQAAASSATDAQTAENNAETAQAAAEAARDAALASLDSFDDRYLGTKSSDPTLDNDGNALVAGALYFNTVSNTMKVYTGTVWVDAYADGNTFLAKANNLSDLTNAATARTNLGVAIGTNVQAWDADLDTWATKTAPSGTVVGTSDSQTLTNKTINADNNTLSGIAASSFVLSNSSGNIDGAAAQKAIPSGVVVGTTDTQTLTNKTISGSSNTLSNIANSSLTNSSITINGSAISLGGSTSVGTVTGVTATSPVASSGGTAPAISLSSGYGDTQNPYASKTAKFVLAAPNAANGAPTFRALVASDIPTLNQDTTGNAGTVTNGVVTTGSYANPSWITSLDDGKVLPSMSSNSGKFLTTNGTDSSWAVVDALPSQTGNSGKYLTTDGTDPSWTNFLSADSNFTLRDDVDNTKQAQFQLSGITTGTTRTYTLPNLSGSLATTGTLTQTFSGTTTFSGATVTVGSSTANSTYGLGSGATTGVSTKTVNIGTAGVSGSTTNINIGSAVSGANNNITVNGSPTVNGTVTATAFVGDGSGLTGISGGQYFGSAAVKAIAYNSQTIAENVTVTAGNNGGSFGPITINSGFTVTVESGANWVII
jgi:hypothetical protein